MEYVTGQVWKLRKQYNFYVGRHEKFFETVDKASVRMIWYTKIYQFESENFKNLNISQKQS